MKLTDALVQTEEKHKEARQKQQEKRKTRPIFASGLHQFFINLYEKYDKGKPPLMKKDDKQKINGLIKALKNNGMEDADIYEFIEQIFLNWDYFKNIEMRTDNRKKYILNTSPDLVDIINCKSQFLQELSKEQEDEEQQEEEQDLLEIWRSL